MCQWINCAPCNCFVGIDTFYVTIQHRKNKMNNNNNNFYVRTNQSRAQVQRDKRQNGMLDERATRSPRSVQMMRMKKKIYNNYSKTRMKCIYKETIATIRYRSRFFASSIQLIFFKKNIFVYLCIYVSVCLAVCEIECEHAQAVLFLCFFSLLFL